LWSGTVSVRLMEEAFFPGDEMGGEKSRGCSPAFGILILDSVGAHGRVGSWSSCLSWRKPAGGSLWDSKSPTFHRGMRVLRVNFAETPEAPPELRSDSCLISSRNGGADLDLVMKIEPFFYQLHRRRFDNFFIAIIFIYEIIWWPGFSHNLFLFLNLMKRYLSMSEQIISGSALEFFDQGLNSTLSYLLIFAFIFIALMIFMDLFLRHLSQAPLPASVRISELMRMHFGFFPRAWTFPRVIHFLWCSF